MKYRISEVEERVYALLDENKTIADQLVDFEDPGMSIAGLIRIYLPEAANRTIIELPVDEFRECRHIYLRAEEGGALLAPVAAPKIAANSVTHLADGRARLELPSEFARLVNFRMSDWDYGVSSPLLYGSDACRLRLANYTRGGRRRSRPAVTIFTAGETRIMYIFGTSTGARIAEFDYLPSAEIVDEIVEIPLGAFDEMCRRIAAMIKSNLRHQEIL